MAGRDFKTLEDGTPACKPANPRRTGRLWRIDPCPDTGSEPFGVPDRLDPSA